MAALGFFRTSSTELNDIPRAASPMRSSFTSIRPSLFRSSCSKSSAQSRSRSGSTPLSWHRARVQPERHPRCHMMLSTHGQPRRDISMKARTGGRRVLRASKKGAVSETNRVLRARVSQMVSNSCFAREPGSFRNHAFSTSKIPRR